MIIVIDDERTFDTNENVTYCRNSNEGLSLISRQVVNQTLRYGDPIAALYLDHDLGPNDTIMDVVDFLCCVNLKITAIFVHTQNSIAGKTIVSVLQRAGYKVERIPLPVLRQGRTKL